MPTYCCYNTYRNQITFYKKMCWIACGHAVSEQLTAHINKTSLLVKILSIQGKINFWGDFFASLNNTKMECILFKKKHLLDIYKILSFKPDDWTSALSTPTTMQGWVLFDNWLYRQTNINGKGMVLCGAKKLQGLNLNTNLGIYFSGKLSHWLKGGVWVLIYYILNQPWGNTCLVGVKSSGMAGLRRAREPLAKYVSGRVTFCLCIAPIKSNYWTSNLINYNYHTRLGPLWKLTLLSKIMGKARLCVVLKNCRV